MDISKEDPKHYYLLPEQLSALSESFKYSLPHLNKNYFGAYISWQDLVQFVLIYDDGHFIARFPEDFRIEDITQIQPSV